MRVFPGLRLQTSETRFRIPDLLVIDRDSPDEEIITHAQMLCVEILSPEDRIPRMEEKIAEYFRMDVRAVWVIDPRTQTGYQCEGASFERWKMSQTLAVPGTLIHIEMSSVIADLDEARRKPVIYRVGPASAASLYPIRPCPSFISLLRFTTSTRARTSAPPTPRWSRM